MFLYVFSFYIFFPKRGCCHQNLETNCPCHKPTFSTCIWIPGNKSAIKIERCKRLFWSSHRFISVSLENDPGNCGDSQWRTHPASECSIWLLPVYPLHQAFQATKNGLSYWRKCVVGLLGPWRPLMWGLPFRLHFTCSLSQRKSTGGRNPRTSRHASLRTGLWTEHTLQGNWRHLCGSLQSTWK